MNLWCNFSSTRRRLSNYPTLLPPRLPLPPSTRQARREKVRECTCTIERVVWLKVDQRYFGSRIYFFREHKIITPARSIRTIFTTSNLRSNWLAIFKVQVSPRKRYLLQFYFHVWSKKDECYMYLKQCFCNMLASISRDSINIVTATSTNFYSSSQIYLCIMAICFVPVLRAALTISVLNSNKCTYSNIEAAQWIKNSSGEGIPNCVKIIDYDLSVDERISRSYIRRILLRKFL